MSRFRLRCLYHWAADLCSEVTSENSVTSPARTHAANGKRVFTGRVPTIFNMAILPRCARVTAPALIFPELKTLANAA